MQRGTIIGADDHGSIWQLAYRIDGNGLGVVTFDHRPFADFYQGVTGSSFFTDYDFGRGRHQISHRLRGLRIEIDGGPSGETVRLEE